MSAIQTLIFPRMVWGVDALQASKLMHLALSKFKCYRRWLNELIFLCFSVSDFRLVDPRGDPFLVQVAHFPLQLPDYIFWFASWWDSAICDGCSSGLYSSGASRYFVWVAWLLWVKFAVHYSPLYLYIYICRVVILGFSQSLYEMHRIYT